MWGINHLKENDIYLAEMEEAAATLLKYKHTHIHTHKLLCMHAGFNVSSMRPYLIYDVIEYHVVSLKLQISQAFLFSTDLNDTLTVGGFVRFIFLQFLKVKIETKFYFTKQKVCIKSITGNYQN